MKKSVSVLIIVLSVVNGFERELKDRLLAMSSHAAIEGIEGQLEGWDELSAFAELDPRVIAAAPYINGQALMIFGEQLSGTELRGIDPQQEIDVSGIGDLMTAGDVATLVPGEFNIVLGVELASHLGVAIGDKVTVTLPIGMVTPVGVIPRNKRFVVSGFYRVGMYEFDRRLAFINLGDAQKLYRRNHSVTGVRLAVREIFDAPTLLFISSPRLLPAVDSTNSLTYFPAEITVFSAPCRSRSDLSPALRHDVNTSCTGVVINRFAS